MNRRPRIRRANRWPRALHELVVALVAVAGSFALATTYVDLTLEQMASAADLAFLGEVADVVVVERDGMPWTRVEFRVERDLLAGGPDGAGDDGDDGEPDAAEGTLQLEFLGGTLPGGPSLAVALMPSFAVGERVVVLAYDELAASPIVGFRQGLWRVEGDALVDETGVRLGLDGETPSAGGAAAPLDALVDAIAALLQEQP